MTRQQSESIASIRYEPHIGPADQLAGHEALKSMYTTVMQIDRLIYQYAKSLEEVQPPVTGKISIRFLRRQSGQTDSRHPHFIQWFRGASSKWLYNRLKPSEILRKLPSYDVFALTREDARELLIQTRSLVELRESLFKDIGRTRRALAMHSAKALKAATPYYAILEEVAPKIKARRQEIIIESRESKAYALEQLPQDGVVNDDTIPRYHPTGRTRGSRTVTMPNQKREK